MTGQAPFSQPECSADIGVGNRSDLRAERQSRRPQPNANLNPCDADALPCAFLHISGVEMLRLDRDDIPQIPRPVYELVVSRNGAEAEISLMVGACSTLPCMVTLVDMDCEEAFQAAAVRWLMSAPAAIRTHAFWPEVAREAGERFTRHLFSDSPSAGLSI